MIEAEKLLNDLQFHGMKESLTYRLSEAIQGNHSHQQFFTFILEDEKLYRKNRRSEMLRKRAKFKDRASLEDFDLKKSRNITKSLLQQLKSLHFINNFENLFFIGKTGAGKSFLAQAIGNECCLNGYESLFIPVNRLFREVEMAEAQGTYLTYMNRLAKVKLLILDDFGLRKYSHKEATVFYELLDDLYRKSSVIVTSQVMPKGWGSLFEDKVIGEAILDRLTSNSKTIEVLAGENETSYRGEFAKTKKVDEKKN